MKKLLILFCCISFAVCNAQKPKISEVSAKQSVLTFLKAYKKSNYDQFFGYKKDLVTNVAFVKNDTVKYYRVNFKNTEEYLEVLKRTNYFSANYINNLREDFKTDDISMVEYPENDGPPEGFDYDWILHTQEPELYLENWNKIKVVSEKIISAKNQEIILQFEYGNRLQFWMTKENDFWKIDTIKSIQGDTK